MRMVCKHCGRNEGLRPDPAGYYYDAKDEEGRPYNCVLSDCPRALREKTRTIHCRTCTCEEVPR